MGNSPGSSGRSTVLKDVSSRLPGCRGLEGEGRRLCSEGASLTRPSDDAYGVHECLYTQTKDKILPVLWIRDEPRLLPWRNLGPVLESAYLLPLKPLALCWGQGRKWGGGNGSSGPDAGSAARKQVPFHSASFSARAGRVLSR